MSNNVSKIRERCMEEIRNRPGILRSELYRMNIGHRSSVSMHVSRMVYEGRVVRVWDDIMLSWRLYPKGKEPQPPDRKEYKRSLFGSGCRSYIPKDAHGDRYYMAFDQAFGLLYIDLKILGMAAREISEQNV